MGTQAGDKLLAADLRLLPRAFASTAARDAYYATYPASLVAGVKCVIGSGAAMVEYVYTGAAWVRAGVGLVTAFTPVWQQLTVGNGANSGWWCRFGPQVQLNILLTLGSTTVISGNPYLTLASNGLPTAVGTAAGSGVCYNSAVGFQTLGWSVDDWIISPQGRISSGSPWNWVAGNYMRLSLTYLTAAA